MYTESNRIHKHVAQLTRRRRFLLVIPYHQHLGQTGRFGHLLDDLEERFETVVGEDDGREALLLGGHQRQE